MLKYCNDICNVVHLHIHNIIAKDTEEIVRIRNDIGTTKPYMKKSKLKHKSLDKNHIIYRIEYMRCI